ncbi:DNA primase [Streptomyces sp. NBC_00120]|uniref:DNA primase n=1 Tax=Streptomyces sp. NBC_00120 TaxID=2975660 RepID=UPI00225B2918|nr:DNA primase [Streptomyces sp. NBC_00120]MCX5327072.1 DNA primase [Streptomyces sp. NBC_00120]
MNRAAVGLAVGAGYVLGRTKKMKLAFAVGTLVAGKRLRLKDALGVLDSPQFKELGDQLREDLAGVGKAATGALVERRMEGLAGALHQRTEGVRDRIEGVAPDVGGLVDGEDRDDDRDDDGDRGDRDRVPAQRSGAGKASSKQPPSKQSGAKKTAAKKSAAKKTDPKSAATKKTAAATRTVSRRAPRTRSKGGRDDG